MSMKSLKQIVPLFRQKKFFLLLPLVPVIVTLFTVGIGRKEVVFPFKKDIGNVTTYCDGGERGNSTISLPDIKENKLTFEYSLRKGHPYPYAGISFDLMHDGVFLNLSKCDYLRMRIRATNTETFSVYLKAFIDGFSVLEEQFTHEFLTKEVSVDPSSTEFTIPFSGLSHPSWWIEQSKISESKIGKPHLTKVISMQIQNGVLTPFDIPITMEIEEISFGRDIRPAYLLLFAGILFYYTSFWIVLWIKKNRKSKQVIISYKELEVQNDSDGDLKRIEDCVARNYSDPNFTVEKLAREAGVSASRIPGLLKQRFNYNFKQYLNTIRITEAKRLLRETDNQIVTLAYTVGYNNIPHFNRTFKQFENISPKEYRRKFKPEKSDKKNNAGNDEEVEA